MLDSRVDCKVFDARDLAVIKIFHLASAYDLENQSELLIVTICSLWVVYLILTHSWCRFKHIHCRDSPND